jgi:predicted RNA binding protein YcfA (HicA-like mRNA interferase family)
MKVKEIIKIIEADGWFFVRQRGSHRQFKHPIKKGTTTIPGKLADDVPKGEHCIVFLNRLD